MRKSLFYILTVILVVFALFPIVMTAIGSVMPETEVRTGPPMNPWFVHGPTLAYYNFIFTSAYGGTISNDPYIRWSLRGLTTTNVSYFLQILANSTIVATSVALLNIILGSLAAYSFARLRYRGSVTYFTFILLSRLLPPVAVALPYYIIMQKLGMLNSLGSIIVVHAVITLPFTIWYLVLYLRSIPVDMEEAALADGASLLQSMRFVLLPMASTGLFAAGLFSFVLSYNEFLFAQFLLGNIVVQTLPVFLGSLSTSADIYWAMMYASVTLTTVPAIIALLVVWRFINISQLAGALKA
jgi:multiple sugar transport system permease protein